MVLHRQQSFPHKDVITEEKTARRKRTLSSPNLEHTLNSELERSPKHPLNANGSLRKQSDSEHPQGVKHTKTQQKKMDRKLHLFNKLKSVHNDQPSLFSSSSGFDNYRGIINLCILLLVLSNFRVALDNVLKYGVLVDPKFLLIAIEDPYNWPCTTLILCSNIFIQICFYIEKALSKDQLSEKTGLILNIINCALVICTPVAVVNIFKPLAWFATGALCWYTAVLLKFVSYISVNKWCREEKASKRSQNDPELKPPGPVVYPQNLTKKDIYYFMIAPTYCYELNFPRTNKIRKRFLIRRIAEAIFLSGVMVALVQQWIVPTVKNSLKPFQDLEFARFTERIMKLAIPNHVIWLIFFYTYFHSLCNIIAEVICFGDRVFYKDWWNSPNITYFWQNWNIPIHRWAKRHVYEPLLRNNYSKVQASLFVFFVSAFFHEFVVSVPLRMLKPWAFLSMLMQVPLAIVTSYMRNPWGNIVVWLSLILGQPMAIMMYYHDYLIVESQ